MKALLAPRRKSPPLINGVSLVEMLLVLAISSIVLAIVSVGFSSLMRLDRKFADGRSIWAKQARLVDAMRRDGHESVRFRFDEASLVLSFWNTQGDEIRYSIDGGDCKRQVIGQAEARTVFRAPDGVRWSAEPAAGGIDDLVVVTFALSESTDQAARAYPIKMALGRDASLSAGANP